MSADAFTDLRAATLDRTVTVETLGGFRAHGYNFTVYLDDKGRPVCVALDLDNGRATIPWRAVNLIHAHSDDEEEA